MLHIILADLEEECNRLYDECWDFYADTMGHFDEEERAWYDASYARMAEIQRFYRQPQLEALLATEDNRNV